LQNRYVSHEALEIFMGSIANYTAAFFVGSVQIDEAFEKSCHDKLTEYPEIFNGIVEELYLVQAITQGDFQAIKNSCGTDLALPKFIFPVTNKLLDKDNVRLEFTRYVHSYERSLAGKYT